MAVLNCSPNRGKPWAQLNFVLLSEGTQSSPLVPNMRLPGSSITTQESPGLTAPRYIRAGKLLLMAQISSQAQKYSVCPVSWYTVSCWTFSLCLEFYFSWKKKFISRCTEEIADLISSIIDDFKNNVSDDTQTSIYANLGSAKPLAPV